MHRLGTEGLHKNTAVLFSKYMQFERATISIIEISITPFPLKADICA